MSETGMLKVELMMESFLLRLSEKEGEAIVQHLSAYVHKNSEGRAACLDTLRASLALTE